MSLAWGRCRANAFPETREVLSGGWRTCTDEDEERGCKNEAIAHARYGSALDLAVKPVELFTRQEP